MLSFTPDDNDKVTYKTVIFFMHIWSEYLQNHPINIMHIRVKSTYREIPHTWKFGINKIWINGIWKWKCQMNDVSKQHARRQNWHCEILFCLNKILGTLFYTTAFFKCFIFFAPIKNCYPHYFFSSSRHPQPQF